MDYQGAKSGCQIRVFFNGVGIDLTGKTQGKTAITQKSPGEENYRKGPKKDVNTEKSGGKNYRKGPKKDVNTEKSGGGKL